MTRDECSLLLYLETCLVDKSGFVATAHMNGADFDISRRWNDAEYISFHRLKMSHITGQQRSRMIPSTHVVRFSDAAWKDVAKLRRERADRVCKPLSEYEFCGT